MVEGIDHKVDSVAAKLEENTKETAGNTEETKTLKHEVQKQNSRIAKVEGKLEVLPKSKAIDLNVNPDIIKIILTILSIVGAAIGVNEIQQR